MKVLFLYSYEYLEPLGIMSLSAVLKQNGHECEFIDLAFEKDYARKAAAMKPGIIAYSVTTGRHGFYRRLNLELKKSMDFFSVFGGPHATFFPEFVEEDGVDAICRGEGEYAMLELAESLQSGRECAGIQNLWVKSGGDIHRNEPRPLVGDLDSLPFVDRALVNKYKHYRNLHRRSVMTGRGCPYRCSYCFNHSYNDLYKGKGAVIRRRSVRHVLDELKSVSRECGPRRFHFLDDTFILDEKWCLDFCRRYPGEVGKPFIAYTRVNLVTDNIVKNLRDAGCVTILYAIESGNDYIRNKVLDRNITRSEILSAVKSYKKYNVRTYAQNMLALPGETIDMAFETVNLNIECRPDYAWCSIFQPYPRTKLGEYCRENGLLAGDDFDESYYRRSILKSEDRPEMENLHHLFSVAVAFPALLSPVRFLIRLPLEALYFCVWHLHRAWCYFFRVNWIDFSEVFVRE
ncbi:MAG: radical SAM protein [Candidatus Omnitrophota bacterium]